MTALSPLLALLAGALSILSPCVLPLIPIVFGGAAAQHRLAPIVLALSLAVSFTAVGLFMATVGFALGLDAELLAKIGGAALAGVGAVLISPSLQTQFAHAAAPLSNWANQRLTGMRANGVWGQVGLGLLLGIVWSPCVGPTLGAASLLAAQGHNLAEVSGVMLAFGIGAASVLAALGYASGGLIRRWRGQLRGTGQGGRRILGAVLIAFGIVMLFGANRAIESLWLENMPDWLTALATKF